MAIVKVNRPQVLNSLEGMSMQPILLPGLIPADLAKKYRARWRWMLEQTPILLRPIFQRRFFSRASVAACA